MSVDPEEVPAVDSENPPLKTAPISSSPPPSKTKGKKKPEKKKPEKSEEDAEEEDSKKPAPQKKSVKKLTSEAEEKVQKDEEPEKSEEDAEEEDSAKPAPEKKPEKKPAKKKEEQPLSPEVEALKPTLFAACANFIAAKSQQSARKLSLKPADIDEQSEAFRNDLKRICGKAEFLAGFETFLTTNGWKIEQKLSKKGYPYGNPIGFTYDKSWEEFLTWISNAPPAASAEEEKKEEKSDA